MGSQNDFFNVRGVAMNGYDIVGFFELRKAIKGKKEFSFLWENIVWRFSNEKHLALFKTSPGEYVPEYGGYCAFGASEGYKASAKPTAFTLTGGKLYFNFAHYVKRRWLEKEKEKIQSADRLWGKTKQTKPIKATPIPIWWKYQLLRWVGKDLFE